MGRALYTPEEYDLDRPRGFLTADDRRFLLGQKDFSDHKDPQASKRTRRHRIRERALNALMDFTLLWDTLDGEDRERIFPWYGLGDDEEPDEEKAERTTYGIHNTVAFAMSGASLDGGATMAEEALQESTLRREAGHGVYADLDYHVKVDSDNSTVMPLSLLLFHYRMGIELDSLETAFVESIEQSSTQTD